MTVFSQPIYFIAAKRTPFGTFLGSLGKYSATDLGVFAAQAALTSCGISPQKVDQVVFGNVLQTSKDAIYLARHIGLRAQVSINVSALTVNRLCGSGFEAIIHGARLIDSGEASCALVGGTESMTQAPHVIRGARRGIALGQGRLEDSLWEALTDTFIDMPMGITAENLAQKYAISQDEVDEYSVLSQKRYQHAKSNHAFTNEITAVDLGGQEPLSLMREDEHPRKSTDIAAFKRLPRIFKADGVIHAGAASGIADGACALVMCDENFLVANNIKPLGELLSFGISGCDPKVMGIGPVMAINKSLDKIKVNLADLNMIEVNEAFAPQVLAVKKELGLTIDDLNTNGGAIAIGHPLAASGARITAHLLHNLKRGNHIGLGSACIGGGQGIAVIVKKCA